MTMLDPHLDVDQLSAAVDGLADETTSAHLATCLACQEQVEVWRRSLGQLKALAVVDAPAPDAAIAAALAAWEPPAAAPAPAPVTPISSARTARRRWRPSGQLVAAVAAIVIVFGGATALIRAGGGGSSSKSSSGAASSSAGASSSSGTSASGAGGSATKSTFGGASAGTTGTPITASERAVLSADLKRYTARNATRAVAASTPCLKEAKAAAVRDAVAAAGGPVAPSYLVPVTYKGVESQAFVFSRSVGYVAFVLKDDTCALVTRLDF